ncbi:MAG: DODA-type extradiol aromatic ring-opening family dioxygenase [Alphaproteobacteria bacterium]
MTELLPAYFISHGAPDIVLRNTPAAQFLRGLKLPPAKAILVISAHWMTEEPMVTAHPHPSTIHDFGGFPKALYDMQYPAVGDALLAAETVNHLAPAWPLSALDAKRGLDHGAWIPLILAEPKATIPVLQLSIQPQRDARHHYEVGKRLRDLRAQGVIIMASGNATHNLRAVFGQRYAETPPPVLRFNDWLYSAMLARDDEELMRWEQAPDAAWNHPTNDHFLPLFTVLGATLGNKGAQRVHHSIDYSVLSMDAYQL